MAHEIPIGKEEDGWNAFESQKERFGRVRPRNFEHVAHVCTVLVVQEGGAISARGPSVRLVFVRFPSVHDERAGDGRRMVLVFCACAGAMQLHVSPHASVPFEWIPLGPMGSHGSIQAICLPRTDALGFLWFHPTTIGWGSFFPCSFGGGVGPPDPLLGCVWVWVSSQPDVFPSSN